MYFKQAVATLLSQYISVAVVKPKSRDGRYGAAHDLNRTLKPGKAVSSLDVF